MFSTPQNDQSLRNNVNEFTRFILLVIRSRNGFYDDYPVPLSTTQAAATDAIIQVLIEGVRPPSKDEIHSLAFALVSEKVQPSETIPFNSAIERFLILLARSEGKSDGWKQLRDFSSHTSRLQWCIRAVVVNDVNLRQGDYEDIYACVISFSSWILLIDISVISCADARLHLLRQDSPNPFNSVRETLALLRHIINASPQEPSVSVSRDKKVLTVFGRPILIQNVNDGIHSMLDRLEELYRQLTHAVMLPELEERTSNIVDPLNHTHYIIDNMRERTVGYSPMLDPQNGFTKYRYSLVEAAMHPAMNSLTGKGTLYMLGNDGVPYFNDDELFEWYETLDEFLEVSSSLCCFHSFC